MTDVTHSLRLAITCPSRRAFLKSAGLAAGWSCLSDFRTAVAGPPPTEPLEIGHEPQFLFDLHVVDNHWPLKRNAEPVRLVFHRPQKHAANPLLHGPGRGGYVYVLRDPAGPF